MLTGMPQAIATSDSAQKLGFRALRPDRDGAAFQIGRIEPVAHLHDGAGCVQHFGFAFGHRSDTDDQGGPVFQIQEGGEMSHGSVDVPQITVLSGEGDDPVAGLGLVHAAFGHGDAAQGGIDVLGHPRGVAADVEVRAVLQPAPQVGGVFHHAVLHVDLAGLVARERGVQPGQRAVAQPGFEFGAVEEIVGAVLVAEEQPGAAAMRLLAARSARKARNGAMPVPGPTMMTGTAGSAGRRKWLVWM